MADQSNEMGMVAKVAQALFDSAYRHVLAKEPSEVQAFYEGMARAAIEAMIPLSDAAAEAGAIALYEFDEGDLADNWPGASEILKGHSRIRARAVVTAALEAALSHDEVKG